MATYTLKIAWPGYNLATGKKFPQNQNTDYKKDDVLNAFYAVMAKSYIRGISAALVRYQQSVALMFLNKNKSHEILNCIYETSSLLENLDALQHYLHTPSAVITKIHNMRNFLRHDLRENAFSKNERSVTRQKTLKMDEGLINIDFNMDGIVIGKEKLLLTEIVDYIHTTDKLANDVIQKSNMEYTNLMSII